jgi:hypothetical protein
MTSLYVDDAAVFLSPLKEDINNLAAILDSFAKVTGFCTNFQKISVVPIRCRHIDLDDILEGIPATHTTFPMKYLGLPLSLWQLKRVDFQHLEDKCTGKFPTWNGNLITTASHILPHPLIVPPKPSNSSIRSKEISFGRPGKPQPKLNAKSIGKRFLDPLSLAPLGYKNLDKFATALLLGGLGLSGWIPTKFGLVKEILAPRKTWTFFMRQQPSPLGMGKGCRFGMLCGLVGGSLRIFLLSSMLPQRKKSGKCIKV